MVIPEARASPSTCRLEVTLLFSSSRPCTLAYAWSPCEGHLHGHPETPHHLLGCTVGAAAAAAADCWLAAWGACTSKKNQKLRPLYMIDSAVSLERHC